MVDPVDHDFLIPNRRNRRITLGLDYSPNLPYYVFFEDRNMDRGVFHILFTTHDNNNKRWSSFEDRSWVRVYRMKVPRSYGKGNGTTYKEPVTHLIFRALCLRTGTRR